MKSLHFKNRLTIPVLFALFFTVTGINEDALGQLTTTNVMIRRTPVQGGVVTPEPGVHSRRFGSEMILSATPKPGYNFVYWIGDVSDPASSRTSANLNSPKIIIAVFERDSYEYLAPSEVSTRQPGGGVIPNRGFSPSGGGGGTVVPDDDDEPTPPELEKEIPVPQEGEPIPEPATAVIVTAGSWFAFRRKRRVKK